MDCSPLGSSPHGILQARILEWVTMPSFRVSPQSRDGTQVTHIYLHWQEGSLLLELPGKPSLAPCRLAKIMWWRYVSFSSLFWPLATGMAFEDIPYGALIWLWPGSHGHFRWGMWPRCPKSQLSLKIRKSGLWALWSQPSGHTAQGGAANGLLFSTCLLPTS